MVAIFKSNAEVLAALSSLEILLHETKAEVTAVKNNSVIKSIQRGVFGAATSGAVIAPVNLSKSVLHITRQASFGSGSAAVQRLDIVSDQMRVVNEYSGNMIGQVAWEVIEYE